MWRDTLFITLKDLKFMLRARETLLWVFVMPISFAAGPGECDPSSVRYVGRSPGPDRNCGEDLPVRVVGPV